MIKHKKKLCKGCNTQQFLFGHSLCRVCYGKKKTEEKKLKASKPRTKIKQVSDKRKNEVNQYRKQRAAYLKKNSCCAINLPGCSGDNMDFLTVHHSRGRENGLLLDEKYWIPACIFCHDRLHTTDTKWAYEKGFLLYKHQITEEDLSNKN